MKTRSIPPLLFFSLSLTSSVESPLGVDIYEATYLGGFPAFSCEKKGKPWVGPPVREGKQSINSYPPPFLLPLSLTRRGRLASPEAAARFPSRTASAIWVSRSADGRLSAA